MSWNWRRDIYLFLVRVRRNPLKVTYDLSIVPYGDGEILLRNNTEIHFLDALCKTAVDGECFQGLGEVILEVDDNTATQVRRRQLCMDPAHISNQWQIGVTHMGCWTCELSKPKYRKVSPTLAKMHLILDSVFGQPPIRKVDARQLPIFELNIDWSQPVPVQP